MPSPNATPTPITPPRVPLVDPRTGLIDRAWYLFFLSLNDIATDVVDDGGLGPDVMSLLASYDAALQALTQNVDTQPPPVGLLSQIAELAKQIEALNLVPPPSQGTVTAVTATAPVASSGGIAPDISLASGYGDTQNPYVAKTANYVLAGPTAGAAAAPAFRALVAADIPALPYGTGDVVGPASATDNAVARFDGTTGKLIQNSVVTISDTGATTGVTTLSASTSVTTPIVQASNSAGLSLKNASGTTQMSVGAGGGDNMSVNVSTNLNGTNAQIDISPTGTGHVHIKPTGTGSVEVAPTNVGTIDNMTIGATTAKNANFVDLSVTGTLSFDAAQGTVGQVLTSSGTGLTPTWTTPTTGTVTSVTGTSPVNSSGGTTPAISLASGYGDTQNPYASKTANYVLAAPNGSSGVPTFRALVAADIPALPYGTGTVTSVSVVSANGFAGTVATATTTPAITLTTSITGLLKGNGTAISAAVVNTDYFAPAAPVTKTADFTVAATEVWLINNKSGSTCTATLPAAASWSGRVLYFQNYQAQTLVSASSNVVPLAGGAAATSILLASTGDSATLVSDGTNWLMTQYIPNNILLLE